MWHIEHGAQIGLQGEEHLCRIEKQLRRPARPLQHDRAPSHPELRVLSNEDPELRPRESRVFKIGAARPPVGACVGFRPPGRPNGRERSLAFWHELS
jgi:hypothetical protein